MPADRPNGGEAPRLLRQLGAAARAYLELLEGESDGPFEVEVARARGLERHAHRHTLDPALLPRVESGLSPVEADLLATLIGHFLSPLELACLRVLARGPLTPDELRERLSRAGTVVGKTKLDLLLAELVKRGVLVVAEEGHRAAGEWVLDLLRRVDDQATGGG